MNAKFQYFVNFLLVVLLSSCCSKEYHVEHYHIKDISIISVNNSKERLSYFNPDEEVHCSAKSFGLLLNYSDTITSIETFQNDCLVKMGGRDRRSINIVNPPEDIRIYSTSSFLGKNPGNDLKLHFLISRNRETFPLELTTENFKEFEKSTSLLLLKPDLDVEKNVSQQFVVEVMLQDGIVRDTSQTIIFQ